MFTNLYAKHAKEKYDSIAKDDNIIRRLISIIATWIYIIFSSKKNNK